MDVSALTHHIGNKDDLLPMVHNFNNFFSQKGSKTVYVSVGSSKSPLSDLDFIESIGCPLHLFDTDDENIKKWNEVVEVLKTRKVTNETTDFAKESSKKWVLARNVNLEKSLPSQYNGTVTIDNKDVKTVSLKEYVQQVCKKMDIDERIDYLKLDTPYVNNVLNTVLYEGYRPSLINVRWNDLPDENVNSMLMAGHLQMLGYSLLSKIDNKFLYLFENNNYYEACSWEKVGLYNPLIMELSKASKVNKNDNVSASASA